MDFTLNPLIFLIPYKTRLLSSFSSERRLFAPKLNRN